MLRPIWIAELRWRPGLVGKLGGLRGWTKQDVDDALLCRTHQRVREDRDPDRGLRLLVECSIAGRPALAVLRPTPQVDVFVLVTAYRR